MPLRTARHAATHIGRYNYGTLPTATAESFARFILPSFVSAFSHSPCHRPRTALENAGLAGSGSRPRLLGAQPEVRDPHAILSSYSVRSIVRLLSPFIFLGLALFYCGGGRSSKQRFQLLEMDIGRCEGSGW